ncbi:hypothetical protein Sjap_017170 [Stephania japonica]|uniref:Uncharacterized protein n=1 Tax=Stephania japonica TaxID=461633 RepID=A0AAP0I5R6_9MAGN
MIKKEMKHELEVGASADEIWGVYSSPDLHKYLLVELLPGVFEKHQLLHGNGDVGTVIFVKFVLGTYMYIFFWVKYQVYTYLQCFYSISYLRQIQIG